MAGTFDVASHNVLIHPFQHLCFGAHTCVRPVGDSDLRSGGAKRWLPRKSARGTLFLDRGVTIVRCWGMILNCHVFEALVGQLGIVFLIIFALGVFSQDTVESGCWPCLSVKCHRVPVACRGSAGSIGSSCPKAIFLISEGAKVVITLTRSLLMYHPAVGGLLPFRLVVKRYESAGFIRD